MKLITCLMMLSLFSTAALFPQQQTMNKILLDDPCTKLSLPSSFNKNLPLTGNKKFYDDNGWRLDSMQSYTIIYPDSAHLSKMHVNYENNGLKEIETYFQRTHENEDWDNYSRITWEYDEEGNIIGYTLEFWIDNEWKNSSYNGYEYDDNGNILISEYLSWHDENDDWWVDQRSEYSYENNLEKSRINYMQLANLTELYAYSKYEKEYDGAGRIFREIYYEPGMKSWKEIAKDEYTYTSDSTVIMKWKFTDDQWLLDKKTIEKNTGLTWYVDRYEYVNKEWMHSYKSTTIYNEDTLMLFHESYVFFESWGWVGSTKITYELYEFFERQYYFSWNQTFGQWDTTNIWEYDYNVDDDGMKYSRYLFFDDESMTWAPVSSSFYFYTNITATNEIGGEKKHFTFFPNPARDFVEVKMAKITGKFQLRIFDLNGKVLLTTIVRSREKQISLKGISPGIYLLEVLTEDGRLSDKLIID